MTGLIALIKRNSKVFFKDKGMFFTSLITPMILLVLYITFLGNVYRDAFSSALPQGFELYEELINGTVGGQLISSLLAVCCVTVAFCSNLLMIQDKVTGARRDLTMSPVKGSVLAASYFISSAFVTLIICFAALGISLIYLSFVGWYMSLTDVVLMCVDVVLLSLFGTALSSLVNFGLSTNGQASAVGTVVSAGYGFICGAYMPISNFGSGLRNVLSFLPGTYGTSLIRNHALRGVYEEMSDVGFPSEVVEAIKDSVDCNLYFYGDKVSVGTMFAILFGSVVVLTALYIIINIKRKKRHNKRVAGYAETTGKSEIY